MRFQFGHLSTNNISTHGSASYELEFQWLWQMSHLTSGVVLLRFRNTKTIPKEPLQIAKVTQKWTRFDLQKDLMHAGGHLNSSSLLEPGRKAKKPLKSSFLLKKWRQKNRNGKKLKVWTVGNLKDAVFNIIIVKRRTRSDISQWHGRFSWVVATDVDIDRVGVD